MKNENYIGKQYKPFDNSWQVNLTEQREHNLKSDYLAGTINTPVKICTIITNPFDIKIKWSTMDKPKTFVIVTDGDGNSHFTLFHKDSVIEPKTDKVQYIIDELKRLQDELK